ncbi:MAG: hypothetical protein AB7O04_16250 [Hyphomonadaceae bacterium]
MSQFDRVIDRIRALPEESQKEAARLLELWLEDAPASLLTDAQWALVQSRLASPSNVSAHEEVVQALSAKFRA